MSLIPSGSNAAFRSKSALKVPALDPVLFSQNPDFVDLGFPYSIERFSVDQNGIELSEIGHDMHQEPLRCCTMGEICPPAPLESHTVDWTAIPIVSGDQTLQRSKPKSAEIFAEPRISQLRGRLQIMKIAAKDLFPPELGNIAWVLGYLEEVLHNDATQLIASSQLLGPLTWTTNNRSYWMDNLDKQKELSSRCDGVDIRNTIALRLHGRIKTSTSVPKPSNPSDSFSSEIDLEHLSAYRQRKQIKKSFGIGMLGRHGLTESEVGSVQDAPSLSMDGIGLNKHVSFQPPIVNHTNGRRIRHKALQFKTVIRYRQIHRQVFQHILRTERGKLAGRLDQIESELTKYGALRNMAQAWVPPPIFQRECARRTLKGTTGNHPQQKPDRQDFESISGNKAHRRGSSSSNSDAGETRRPSDSTVFSANEDRRRSSATDFSTHQNTTVGTESCESPAAVIKEARIVPKGSWRIKGSPSIKPKFESVCYGGGLSTIVSSRNPAQTYIEPPPLTPGSPSDKYAPDAMEVLDRFSFCGHSASISSYVKHLTAEELENEVRRMVRFRKQLTREQELWSHIADQIRRRTHTIAAEADRLEHFITTMIAAKQQPRIRYIQTHDSAKAQDQSYLFRPYHYVENLNSKGSGDVDSDMLMLSQRRLHGQEMLHHQPNSTELKPAQTPVRKDEVLNEASSEQSPFRTIQPKPYTTPSKHVETPKRKRGRPRKHPLPSSPSVAGSSPGPSPLPKQSVTRSSVVTVGITPPLTNCYVQVPTIPHRGQAPYVGPPPPLGSLSETSKPMNIVDSTPWPTLGTINSKSTSAASTARVVPLSHEVASSILSQQSAREETAKSKSTIGKPSASKRLRAARARKPSAKKALTLGRNSDADNNEKDFTRMPEDKPTTQTPKLDITGVELVIGDEDSPPNPCAQSQSQSHAKYTTQTTVAKRKGKTRSTSRDTAASQKSWSRQPEDRVQKKSRAQKSSLTETLSKLKPKSNSGTGVKRLPRSEDCSSASTVPESDQLSDKPLAKRRRTKVTLE